MQSGNIYLKFLIILIFFTSARAQVLFFPQNQTIDTKAISNDSTIRIDDMIFKVKKINKTSAAFQETRVWPDAKVYYSFHPNLPQEYIPQFQQAFSAWQQGTPLQFIERTTENNYILIVPSDENSSYVGMVMGEQELKIVNKNVGTSIHELGHALGLVHEHQRSDRDQYVIINTENIDPEYVYAFDYYPSINYTPYDFFSIMHYPKYAFSINGQPTIETKPNFSHYSDIMGRQDSLTTYDKLAIVNMYNNIPVLMQPEQEAINIQRNNPELAWSTVPDAMEYQVQLAFDEKFQNISFDKTTPELNPGAGLLIKRTYTVDSSLFFITSYYWRVRAITENGPMEWSDTGKFTTDYSAEEDIRLISSFPNPFRDKVTITFRAIRAGHVTIAIYNLLGEKVADLVSRKCQMGFHTQQWDAGDCPNGIYFAYYQRANTHQTCKLLLCR